MSKCQDPSQNSFYSRPHIICLIEGMKSNISKECLRQRMCSKQPRNRANSKNQNCLGTPHPVHSQWVSDTAPDQEEFLLFLSLG